MEMYLNTAQDIAKVKPFQPYFDCHSIQYSWSLGTFCIVEDVLFTFSFTYSLPYVF